MVDAQLPGMPDQGAIHDLQVLNHSNRLPMWSSVLAALPPLPHELQYRFVGRDLVLVDTHADLVVDILRNAVP